MNANMVASISSQEKDKLSLNQDPRHSSEKNSNKLPNNLDLDPVQI